MSRHPRRWMRDSLVWVPFVLLGILPVVVLLVDSLFPASGGTVGEPWRRALLNPGRLELLWNSLLVGVGVAVAALLVGVPFGFLVSRTDLRGRGLYEGLALVPLLIAPYISGIAWTQFAQDARGAGWELRLGGYPAIVLILAAGYFPIVTLLAARAFRAVGEETESAARLMLGERRALRRVTLPLAPCSSRKRRALASAGMVGTLMWSRNISGAAPVPPPRPSNMM